MRHLADHLANGSAQQPRIGVQRDDITNVLRYGTADHFKTGILGPAQQPVQFRQFAALAFPPHPDPFGRVPQAATVQEKEPVAIIRRVARIQPCNCLQCGCDQLRVMPGRLGIRIHRIRQQGIMQRTIGAGQVMHFQALYLRQKLCRIMQQHRYRHQGSQLWRYAFCQIKARKRRRWHRPCDDGVHNCRANLCRDTKSGNRQYRQSQHPGPRRPGQRQAQRKHCN